MSKNNAKPKKPRRFLRGVLCVIFAAAAFGAGAHVINGLEQQTASTPHNNGVTATVPSAVPQTFTVFNEKATKTPAYDDPYNIDWMSMEAHQKYYMSNATDAAAYKAYLATFNQFKGESLDQMATNVNRIVNQQTTYTSDPALYGAKDYWAAPIETEMAKRGDCEDYAILQDAIMRSLGVPDSRLFVSSVNAEGSSNGPDHVALLMNDAPAGAAPHFVVMNDVAGVLPADNSIIGKTWQVVEDNGTRVKSSFVFYDARNDAGFWSTKLTPRDYQQAPQTAQVSPYRGRITLKMG